jgi:DNA-directed RNA polymerase III subunit RPC6
MANNDAEEFWQMCNGSPEGLTGVDISGRGWTNDRVIAAVNVLLQTGRLELLKQAGGGLVYKARSEEQTKQFQNLAREDMIIYQLIEGSHSNGIWTKTLKDKSNMQTYQITQIIKRLEAKKLIKAVKSIQFKNRKVYMLYDVEPSREVSGGSWYRDGDLDNDLIEDLRTKCLEYIRTHHKRGARVTDVANFISTAGVEGGASGFGEDDIKTILRTLLLDQLVYVQPKGGEVLYFPTQTFHNEMFATIGTIPCTCCNLVKDCSTRPGAAINPKQCEYWTDWLSNVGFGASAD